MKKLIWTLAVTILGSLGTQAQVYPHDFQKVIGLPFNGVTNYTLEKRTRGGYAMAGIVEDFGSAGIHQRTMVMFLTDQNFNVTRSLFCAVEEDQYGNVFLPQDIAETPEGNFVVCGAVLRESADENGGFIMHITNDRNEGLLHDWIQIYVNSNSGGNNSVSILTNIVSTANGYMAIGRSRYAAETKGIVIGVDHEGDLQWSNLLYDDQYGTNYQSILNDMVRVDEHTIAITGIVNSFTIDDADIFIVVLDEEGRLINERVYERADKKINDGQPAYLERAKAIAYNSERKALVIAGTATEKQEGVCMAANFRRLLTLEVDLETLNLNWSRMHEINSDLSFSNSGIVCGDIAYDPLSDQYAVTGIVNNNAFSSTTNENGFIMRLNSNGIATNLRYYGTERMDRLSKIYAASGVPGTFVAAGMADNGGKNYALAVGSFQNIDAECQSVQTIAGTDNYPLQPDNGIVKEVRARQVRSVCEEMLPLVEEETFCPVLIEEEEILFPEVSMSIVNKSTVYPTVLENGMMLNVQNDQGFKTYRLITLDGSRVMATGALTAGLNELSVQSFSAGTYFLQLQDINGGQAVFKLVVQ